MNRSILVLLSFIVIDQLDSGMATPLYPLLFTDPESPALLVEASTAESSGNWFLALLAAAYALPAFMLQLVLGQLSDRYGRKPMLLVSFATSALSYGLFALGVWQEAIWLLVVARIVDGTAAGNILVAASAVADSSNGEERTQFFGYFTAALSLGFVLGPLVGGYLGNPEGADWQGPATAFVVGGVLNVLVVGLFYLLFHETLDEDNRDDGEEFSLGQSFRNARIAFADKDLRPYFLILGCFIFAFTTFLSFFNVVLSERFEFDSQATGWYFSGVGLALMLVQVFLVNRVEKWLGPQKLLWANFFLMGGATVAMALSPAPWLAVVCILPFALGTGMIEPMIQSLLTRSADESQQGRIQGVRGSVDSLARVVPPFLAGPIAAFGAAHWAVAGAGGVAILGGVLALRTLVTDERGTEEVRDGPALTADER